MVFLVQYNTDAHPYGHTYANLTPMSTSKGLYRQIWRFPKAPIPVDLEIPEVTIGASLSTEKNNMVGDTYYTHSTMPYLIS